MKIIRIVCALLLLLAGVSPATASTYSASVVSTGPQVYWRMNDASGNFADSSGNGFNATNVGTWVYSQVGPQPGGDTSNMGTYGQPGGHAFYVFPTLNISNGYTLGMFAKLTNGVGFCVADFCSAAELSYGGNYYGFGTCSGNTTWGWYTFNTSTGITSCVQTGATSSAAVGWSNILVTVTSSGAGTVYFNGASYGTFSVGSLSSYTATAITQGLGSSFSGYSGMGWITGSEYAFWNKVLTQSQITTFAGVTSQPTSEFFMGGS